MRNPRARLGISVVTSVALVLAGLPALAAATAPKHHHRHAIRPKDGTYQGTLSVGLKKVVVMDVNRNGTKADAHLICDGQPYGHIRMKISKATFSGTHQLSPGVQVWTLRGHFSSKKTAAAFLGGGGVCDGRSGMVTLRLT
jgi:hypothetical protein